jgi:SAM-dependent methyltransferase
MDAQIIRQLIEINHKFYSEFAHAFSETRSSAQTRLERIVAYIRDDVKVLDLGCGNGRLAERLDREGRRVQYVGIDASPELVAIARARQARLRNVAAEFFRADITEGNWRDALGDQTFDIAVALAVLHHIPGFALRVRVLREIHARLKSGGMLVMTNWQFDRVERVRKRIVAWDVVGIAARDVEPGDALLAWKRGGVGYRYVHLIAKSEAQQLAKQSGFRVVRQFYADAELNLYSVLEREK